MPRKDSINYACGRDSLTTSLRTSPRVSYSEHMPATSLPDQLPHTLTYYTRRISHFRNSHLTIVGSMAEYQLKICIGSNPTYSNVSQAQLSFNKSSGVDQPGNHEK